MRRPPERDAAAGERPAPPAIVWLFTLAFVAFELAFTLAETGVLPASLNPAGPDLRWDAFVELAFFDVYFEAALGGEPYAPTLWSSFFTHALLHGGTLHLVMNAAIFLALGGVVANLIGPARFSVLVLVCAAAGALAFGLISDTRGALVGASGVIFGFFGALKRWEWRYIRASGASSRRFWGTIAALVVMNLALFLFFTEGGAIAWEAHLGGFVAGWLIAPLLAPGRAGPSPI